MLTEPRRLSARKVWERFDVTDRTLSRWVADPRLQFPQPIVVNRRRYFAEDEIEAFEQRRKAKADVSAAGDNAAA